MASILSSIATRASIIRRWGAKFNRYYLFIANYNSRQPSIDGRGKCNIWQYSETGHLHGDDSAVAVPSVAV